MIAAGWKRRRAGLGDRREETAEAPGRPRRIAVGIGAALLYPLALSVSAATFPYRRLRPKRAVRETVEAPAPPPEPVFEDEWQTSPRFEALGGQARTIAYLLQSCIIQLDQLVHGRRRVEPLKQPRSMPAAGLRIARARHYNPGVARAHRGIRAGLAATMLLPLFVLGAGFGGSLIYDSYVNELVPPESMAVNHPSRGARIYDRNGHLLYEYVDDREGVRIPVKLEDVSDAFLAATIATEDESFFTNPGINPRGLARAGWENLGPYVREDEETQALEGSGGSSITQQLVKNVYIPPDQRLKRSLDRKVREALYAVELTNRYDKHQILEWYVNQISYGGIYNGVEAASEGYFGKPAKELTLAEAALLAGIPQSPATYDPLARPEAALARRDEVLDLMAKRGSVQIGKDRWYTPAPEQLAAAKETPVPVSKKAFTIDAPHFVLNHVAPELEAMFGKDALYHDGLIVTTTLDIELQHRTQEVLERWIREFEQISNSRNGAVVVIDNHTGEIVTLIGSRDYFRDDIQGNVDNIAALNSPGSTFKPFVYLTSFMKLGWTPNTIIEDTPVAFRESDGTYFSPTNPSKNYMGSIPIKTALGNSLNVPAFKTAMRLGVPPIVDTAKQLGFTTLHGTYGPSIATGGVDLTAMDLTYGYSVLANNGAMVGETTVRGHAPGERTVDPISVLSVKDASGKLLYDVNEHREQQQVVPAEQAFLVTSILSDGQNQCATFGCGGVSIPGRIAGVKTGTSEPFAPTGPNAGKIGETWAFGYTPDYAVGVWAGNSDNAPVINIFSTSISFRVMRDTMQTVYDGKPSGAFARPDGIEERKVCGAGGVCRSEFYLKGSAPPAAPPPAPTEPRITAAGLPNTSTTP